MQKTTYDLRVSIFRPPSVNVSFLRLNIGLVLVEFESSLAFEVTDIERLPLDP